MSLTCESASASAPGPPCSACCRGAHQLGEVSPSAFVFAPEPALDALLVPLDALRDLGVAKDGFRDGFAGRGRVRRGRGVGVGGVDEGSLDFWRRDGYVLGGECSSGVLPWRGRRLREKSGGVQDDDEGERGGQLTSADMATSSASCSVCGGVGLEKRELGEGRRERKSRTRPDEAEAEEDARQRARRVPALDPNPQPRPALSPQEWTGLA